MIDKAIINGKIYQEGKLVSTNLYITDEKIFAISKEFFPALEEIDAKGLYVFPGIIDPHVHFDLDVGTFRSADNFEKGSMIAALGGVTTIIDFLEPVDNEHDLEKAYRKRIFAAEDSKIDYKFHACIKDPKCDLETFVLKMMSLGMNSLKCFTTYSESGRMTYDEDIIKLLRLSDKYKFLLLVHAEDNRLIKHDPDYTFRDLNKSRPKEAEINKALQLAGLVSKFGGYLYMVHVSSGETIERLKESYSELLNKRFFIESCPQYFVFDDSVLNNENGYLYTCAPPIRSESEKTYLQENIDWIYTIGTDHCPFRSDEKAMESLNMIPLGIGSIEHSFDVLYHMFKEKIVDKMTKNVAILHHLENQKGKLKVGLDADLFFYKPGASKINDDHSDCDYSIYKGLPKSGTVVSTMVRGNFVVRDRSFESGFGKLLQGSGY